MLSPVSFGLQTVVPSPGREEIVRCHIHCSCCEMLCVLSIKLHEAGMIDTGSYMTCLCMQQFSKRKVLQRIACETICAHGSPDSQQDAHRKSTHGCPCMQLHLQSQPLASILTCTGACMTCVQFTDVPSCDTLLHFHASDTHCTPETLLDSVSSPSVEYPTPLLVNTVTCLPCASVCSKSGVQTVAVAP